MKEVKKGVSRCTLEFELSAMNKRKVKTTSM